MIPDAITSEELKELVQEQIGGKIEDPSFNLESPYAVSLPLSDWISIIDRLNDYEELGKIINEKLAEKFKGGIN